MTRLSALALIPNIKYGNRRTVIGMDLLGLINSVASDRSKLLLIITECIINRPDKHFYSHPLILPVATIFTKL